MYVPAPDDSDEFALIDDRPVIDGPPAIDDPAAVFDLDDGRVERYDAGDYDAGDYDAGDYDAGDYDAGDYDAGDYDAGDYDADAYDADDYDPALEEPEDFVSTAGAPAVGAGRHAVSRDADAESWVPKARRQIGSTRRFLALSATFAALLVVLVFTGYRSSLRMTGGASISPQQRSPSEPGYEAAVKPTPVTFLAVVNDGGDLRALSFVTQGSGEAGGTIITVPLSLLLANDDGAMRIPNYIEAEDGMDELQTELEKALGFGMTKQLIVTQSEIEDLLGGEPLKVRNPEQLLIDFQGTLVPQFESGDLALDPDGLMSYVNYLGPEESEYNRLNRQQLVFEQLLALSEQGFEPSSNDENVTALAELLTAVGAGESSVTQLPVTEGRIGGREDGGEGQGASFTAPDTEAIDATLGDIIPFPVSGFPGQRLGVKLLNGTTEPQLELRLAGQVVGAGGEVRVVGNAKKLDQARTTVAVSRDATEDERAQAQRVAEALNAELTETDNLGEEVRAVVVVGQDQA
ncbi:MAG: LytR C-terminal domain-containing protein [Candidatus Microthrix sp.]|nr:LytR C-terminal domain-containing protein [Candidatus Microthrix sp.]